ncbi:iron-siderophore ABC transporter substrate-binding protein [Pleurocapsa sp. CCALA 161]|uniref:ABC transporter substrate-binding protein n=1 Tax=Pleurocapsa sp. CCALA 161 TaxID=2107688 RepID=UPI000D07D862|nr:iron-siderophore ABC transporter substrate-binding protein [Pleurocapsa sp. CCALA 161]PSB09505.1 iron-siderophore ABC transporter substrate-binding protein [Pleurocapsa sp. CCALA 161]
MIEILISAIAIILLLYSARLKQLNPYRFLAIFSVTITLLTISSCYQNTSQPDPTAVGSAGSCRAIAHFMGETCVPENPQRIISLYTTPLANLLALDLKPLAITPVTGVQDEFPPYLAEKVEGMEIVGINYEPNLERIAQLKPDLIVGWDFHEKTYPLLSQISPTLLVPKDITQSPNADWQKYTNYLATALGKQDKAQQLIAEYDRRIAELKIALGNRYSNKTISVAHISDEYGTEAYTVNSFPGSILSALGLQRPQSQAVSKPGGTIDAISEERLELIDGDLLFVLIYNDSDRQMLNSLLNKPLWKKLKAVQNQQVYPVDGWTWGVANPLAANAVINDMERYLIGTSQ